MDLVTSAAEAAARYNAHLDDDLLVQSAFHVERDGRHLACGLGVLGDSVESPSDCPASVMPRWLALMVPGFFDRQRFEDAKDWGKRFYEQLARLDGNVPFSALHDWQAVVVGPFAIELAEKQGRNPEPHKALAEMQLKAMTGEKFSADEWRPILRAAFYDTYFMRYRADADAAAYAAASTDADAEAYAEAAAYAAYAGAYADAEADAEAYAEAAEADVWKRLADGMVDALKRAADAAESKPKEGEGK